jgi:branched-chain amino acid transport system substrate-binding protein
LISICGRPGRSASTGLLSIVVAASVGVAACGSATSSTDGAGKSPITIGVSAAETGYLSASSDIPFLLGVRYAVQSIDSEGGVKGHPLKLAAVLDEKSVSAVGVANVKQLINQDHADVVMTGADSIACALSESAVDAAKVPTTCISPPPNGSAYEFQVAASVPGMVQAMTTYVKAQHITSVALVGVATVYGELIANMIKTTAAAYGIKVVFTATVPPTSTNLTATMQQVKAAQAGAVVDSLTGPEHVVEAEAATAAGLTVPLIQITDTTNVFQQAARAYPHLYFVMLPPQAYPNIISPSLDAALRKFVTFYKAKKANMGQIAATAYGWDAVHILAAAMAKSGADTGPALEQALNELTYQGANSQYMYAPWDHSGEMSVANPDSIGHFTPSGKLEIGYYTF